MAAKIRFEASSAITMSAARQSHQSLAGLALAVAVAVLTAIPGWAATVGPIVTDPQTGAAISGFDPVSYFTEAAPRPGKEDVEYAFSGTTWRFCNEGNRAAFVDQPDVYAPQFGGYDPVAIARGMPVAGHPLVWLISGERLYLFYDAKARAEFAAAPQRMIDVAERRWADVRRTLP
jgi:YHS domain-containing protein